MNRKELNENYPMLANLLTLSEVIAEHTMVHDEDADCDVDLSELIRAARFELLGI